MKKICMFCGKEHKRTRPLDCKIKAAATTSLFKSIDNNSAMYIADRTDFLKLITQNVKEILKGGKNV